MKICIVSNSHHTTDVRLYYKMARSLAKQGEVHLICASGVRNDAVNPYQVVVDTESSWYALFLLYQKARKIKPDVVICVEPLTMFVGLALRRKLGTKVIFDVHEFFADAFSERSRPPFSWLLKTLYLGFERWLERRSDATIAVSDEILDQLVPSRLRDRAVTIPNYPVKNVWDYSCETPADLSTICSLNFDLIYIGGITPDRGVFKVLRSVSLLKREFPSLNVLILGKFFSDEVKREFDTLINTLSLNAIVYYQNWIPAEKIGLLLKRSRVGLWIFNPLNRRMRKAVPLKVLEYLAAGLPVISINTPLMRDLVEKNRVGLCCEFQPAAIANAAGELLRLKPSEYQEMSRRARDLIENNYNWEAIEPRLFSVVKQLVP
ncbi:MAG: glycosyltransferase family 4 protein [Candidatus Syntrophosphaera sp.]|nr:glycosyltransferase family 4 protein [Candidatus Syntrophosphaera sp.]